MSKVRVKVCGITSPKDAEAAANAGVDAIGMVFYPKSGRHISDLGLAREIALSAGPFVTVTVLTVNSEKSDIERILGQVPVNLLQFHGDENEEFCTAFNTPYIKALRMKEGIDILSYIDLYPNAHGILLDSYVKGVPGGTGESFNWERVPQKSAKPIILAGGLTPDNVHSAVKVAMPYAVDVSGGVEASVGIKDQNKVEAFVKNAKLETVSDK